MSASQTLRSILRTYPGKLSLTPGLVAAENALLLAYPLLASMVMTAATLPPFEGALAGTPYAGHYSPAKDAMRRQFNDWIRTAGVFDAVADFDAVLRDPGHPGRLRAAFDSGDHLHPGDAGYRALAAAIDPAPLLAAPESAPLHGARRSQRAASALPLARHQPAQDLPPTP